MIKRSRELDLSFKAEGTADTMFVDGEIRLQETEKLEGALYRSHTQYLLTDRHSIWCFFH